MYKDDTTGKNTPWLHIDEVLFFMIFKADTINYLWTKFVKLFPEVLVG